MIEIPADGSGLGDLYNVVCIIKEISERRVYRSLYHRYGRQLIVETDILVPGRDYWWIEEMGRCSMDNFSKL